MSNLASLVC